ncbi:MAG: hypothetical protein IJA82_01450 [Clostridia bacterium]|nr:hypothetical protein [Clostridia bacterium]
MANCKSCRHFDMSAFVCKNRNVNEQHKLNGGSCSYFAATYCGDCRYCHHGGGLFVRMNLYCSAHGEKQVQQFQAACSSFSPKIG